MASIREWLDGKTADGRLLPLDKVNIYRGRRGLAPLDREEWNPSKPCRGLGDVIAKVTHVTGIDRLVKRVTKGGCGCKKRQEALNAAVPFGGANDV